ncbi:MAG: heavy metal-binding domain-containing protein [Minisyncoccota bacterium]
MDQSTSKIYTCPMHPEVVSDKSGRCPKCGMALVPSDEKPKVAVHHGEDKGLGILTWRSYMPLIVIILMITVVAGITSWTGQFSLSNFLLHFMTGFFLVFAGFKLMDLKGFAEGYSTYDLLGQKWFGYGYIYPFIELAFGLLMLAGFHSSGLLWAEFLVMSFSGIGVAVKIAKREPFMCACLGTFLKVPLTYVTLIEDFGMALLALTILIITL